MHVFTQYNTYELLKSAKCLHFSAFISKGVLNWQKSFWCIYTYTCTCTYIQFRKLYNLIKLNEELGRTQARLHPKKRQDFNTITYYQR